MDLISAGSQSVADSSFFVWLTKHGLKHNNIILLNISLWHFEYNANKCEIVNE
jgi:hypothetical protein